MSCKYKGSVFICCKGLKKVLAAIFKANLVYYFQRNQFLNMKVADCVS